MTTFRLPSIEELADTLFEKFGDSALAASSLDSNSVYRVFEEDKQEKVRALIQAKISEAEAIQRLKPIAEANLKNPDLLKLIKNELDKRHVQDNLEKMFAFCHTRTAYLKNPRDHQSVALKGDASVGKDNLIDAIKELTPKDDFLKLTHATGATLEDDLGNVRIVAFSEVNQYKGGANASITENLKQISEGGMNALKKDTRTGFKSARRSEQNQITTIYGTTQEKTDDELATRYTPITILGEPTKIERVNNATLANSADLEFVINSDSNDSISWVAVAHSCLEQAHVILPYTNLLSSGSSKYFDNKNPRSQRDLKRLISLAKALAWLHQKQRPIFEYKNERVILSAPADLINALRIGGPFFNLAYSGIDERAKNLLAELKEKHPAGITQSELRAELDITPNTLRKRIRALENMNLITVEDEGQGKDKRIIPTQNPLKTWSKPHQEKIIKECLEGFEIKKWLYEMKIDDKILMGFEGVFTTPFEGVLYVVEEPTPSVKSEDAQKKLSDSVSTPIFEGVKIEGVVSP